MWFVKQKGIDYQVLQKTKYWHKLEALLDTDKQTQAKIVQYIYEQVSDGICNELHNVNKNTEGMSKADTEMYIIKRIDLINGYKELAYGKQAEGTKKD